MRLKSGPILCVVLIAASCSLLEPDHRDYELWVAPEQVDCVGVAPMRCLLVRRSATGDWQYFYDSIEGFNYQAGFHYRLRVRETEIRNPPADGSSVRYRLLEVIEKTPAADQAPSRFR